MADTNLLAQLLAGGPLAPMQVGGYQGSQLQDASLNPAFGHNEGPFGALAKTLAGFSGGPALRQAVQATTAARMGANPDLARLLASNDPFAAAAAPGVNPTAAGLMLAGQTPESAANARKTAAEAALAGLNLAGFQKAGSGATVTPALGRNAGAAMGAPSASTAPGAPLSVGGTGYLDPIEGVLALPSGSPQQTAAFQRLSKPQKAALAAKLKAQGPPVSGR